MGSRSERQALRDLVAAVAPLVDPETEACAADGEELHKRLTEAYRAAEEALKSPKATVTITDMRPPPPEIRIVPVPIRHEGWLRT